MKLTDWLFFTALIIAVPRLIWYYQTGNNTDGAWMLYLPLLLFMIFMICILSDFFIDLIERKKNKKGEQGE